LRKANLQEFSSRQLNGEAWRARPNPRLGIILVCKYPVKRIGIEFLSAYNLHWFKRFFGGISLPKKAASRRVGFADPYVGTLLRAITAGKTALNVSPGKRIFSQGDTANAIYFIETGKVKISVISGAGKEAVLVILGPRNFFGEGSLVGQQLRISSATALEPSAIFRVEKKAMLRALSSQPHLSEKFIASLLVRNIDLEEDLCDQLFNQSEKRLARVLLKLSRLRQPKLTPNGKIPLLSHETLAEMVGTTRSRITHFMNKFRKMGLIDYNGELTVRAELLTDVVLHD
jgi:CRP/FNR family cyclic AMP-dependent transcriptional regulator